MKKCIVTLTEEGRRTLGELPSKGEHESLKQMIAETKVPIPASPGETAKHDYEYKRCGVCNVFLACEPLAGKRTVKITERKTKLDWACFIEGIANQYESAKVNWQFTAEDARIKLRRLYPTLDG